MIAEASFPSTGLGIEMQIAETAGIPLIVLVGGLGMNRVGRAHYENPDRSPARLADRRRNCIAYGSRFTGNP